MSAPRTLPEIVLLAARLHGDRPAYSWVGRREGRAISGEMADPLSFAGLELLAGKAAGAFASAGIKAAEPVALLCENRPGWVAACLGLLRRGAVVIPLDPLAGPDGHAARIERTKARFLAVCESLLPAAEGLRAEALLLDGPTGLLSAAAGSGVETAEGSPFRTPDPCDPALILFTSGTGGRERAVPLTHAHLVAEAMAFRDVLPRSATRRTVNLLPLHHVLGFNLAVPLALLSGTHTLFPERIRREEILQALAAHRPTVLGLVPSAAFRLATGIGTGVAARGAAFETAVGAVRRVRRLVPGAAGDACARAFFAPLRRPLGGRLRAIVSSGAALDEPTFRFFLDLGVRVVEAYGLTETTGGVTVTDPRRPRPGTAGRPVRGMEIAIRPFLDHSRWHPSDSEAAPATEGEILVRGPMVMGGYLDDPVETARCFRDGWLRTGDLGRLEPDGTLVLAGRASDRIVLPSGLKVSPDKVERALARVPAVLEIAVCVEGPREAPALCAVAVPDRDALARQGILDAAGFLSFEIARAAANLATHERPVRIRLVPGPLPRTTTLKLRRDLLAVRLQDPEWGLSLGGGMGRRATRSVGSTSRCPSLQADEGIEAAVQAAFEEICGVPLSAGASLSLDAGLDSMARLELLDAIERRLGLPLSERTVLVETSGEVVQAVRTALSHGAARIAPLERLTAPLTSEEERLLTSARRRARAMVALAEATHLAFGVFARIAWRLHVAGLENIEGRQGPFLLCPNHASEADVLLVPAALPARLRRSCWGLARRDMSSGPLRRLFLHGFRGLALDNRGDWLSGLRLAAHLLREGLHVVAFPEGRRSFGCGVTDFLPGAGLLALATGADLVPVAIAGSERALPPGSGRPRLEAVTLRFGQPISAGVPAGVGWSDLRIQAESLMAETRSRVLELLKAGGSVEVAAAVPERRL